MPVLSPHSSGGVKTAPAWVSLDGVFAHHAEKGGDKKNDTEEDESCTHTASISLYASSRRALDAKAHQPTRATTRKTMTPRTTQIMFPSPNQALRKTSRRYSADHIGATSPSSE